MRGMTAAAVGILAAPVLALYEGPLLARERLSGPALRQALEGRTLEVLSGRGAGVRIHLERGGRMRGTLPAGRPGDEGRWEVVGGQFCRQWFRWGGGRYECQVVDAERPGHFRFLRARGDIVRTRVLGR